MGFFSWNCKGCNESIKAPYDLPKEIAWQNDAVVIGQGPNKQGPNINRGSYDGYGSINGIEIIDMFVNVRMWHTKCWTDAGSPLEDTGASTHADDQGFFYGDKESPFEVECFEVVDEDYCEDD